MIGMKCRKNQNDTILLGFNNTGAYVLTLKGNPKKWELEHVTDLTRLNFKKPEVNDWLEGYNTNDFRKRE